MEQAGVGRCGQVTEPIAPSHVENERRYYVLYLDLNGHYDMRRASIPPDDCVCLSLVGGLRQEPCLPRTWYYKPGGMIGENIFLLREVLTAESEPRLFLHSPELERLAFLLRDAIEAGGPLYPHG